MKHSKTTIMSTYKLAILEPYLPLKHGILNQKQHHHLYGHYLVLDTVELHEFYNNIGVLHNDTQNLHKLYNDKLNKLAYEMNNRNLHPTIRNYQNIIKNETQFSIQIIEQVTISTGPNEWDNYSTAINKTHWIRLIQRRWRETLRKRIQLMKNVKNLQSRETSSQWAKEGTIKFRLGL
jgi:hypothetical protein